MVVGAPPKPALGAGVAAGVLAPKEKLVVGLAGVEEKSEPAPAEVDAAPPKEGVPNALVCWGAELPNALAGSTSGRERGRKESQTQARSMPR